jgi:hypothetical protein
MTNTGNVNGNNPAVTNKNNGIMTLEEISVPSMSNNRRGSNDWSMNNRAYALQTNKQKQTYHSGNNGSSSTGSNGSIIHDLSSRSTASSTDSENGGEDGVEVNNIGEVAIQSTTLNSGTAAASNSNITVPSGGNDDNNNATTNNNNQGAGEDSETRSIGDDDIASTIEIGAGTNHNNGGDDNDGGGDVSSHTSGWGEGDQSSHGTTDTGYTPNTINETDANGNPSGSEDSPLNIARKENRAVSLWRIFMFCVLITTTYAVAALVYAFTSNFEAKEFESAFADDTLKIYESLGSSLDTKLAAVDSLAMLMVSSAREKGEEFPFTTLTDFASKAAKVRCILCLFITYVC